jgi:YHS domain-containing protein
MKKTILILVTITLAVLVGCTKKTEPTTQSAMDMTKATAKQAADQAGQAAADAQKTAEKTVAAATEQTVCPVMAGNPIDKNVFVEYKGKKVYFCCESCKADFNKDPEKYIKDLPQFKQ